MIWFIGYAVGALITGFIFMMFLRHDYETEVKNKKEKSFENYIVDSESDLLLLMLTVMVLWPAILIIGSPIGLLWALVHFGAGFVEFTYKYFTKKE